MGNDGILPSTEERFDELHRQCAKLTNDVTSLNRKIRLLSARWKLAAVLIIGVLGACIAINFTIAMCGYSKSMDNQSDIHHLKKHVALRLDTLWNYHADECEQLYLEAALKNVTVTMDNRADYMHALSEIDQRAFSECQEDITAYLTVV